MPVTDIDIPAGTELDVRGMGTVVLEELLNDQGGYGVVYRGIRTRDGRPVAVKFMRRAESGATDEERRKNVERFEREIKTLRHFCAGHRKEWGDGRGGLMPPFPEFCKRGELWGIPFYVMEWLLPVNLLTLDTNDKRYKYVWDVCYAVATLHGEGYVHYDIKPSNIMLRDKEEGGIEYVLVDFGSVHKIDESGSKRRTEESVSQLNDGRRVYPHTPGYADPLETLHTINADIYAIGQVVRDTFKEAVSPEWAGIIDKCTSRNRAYRYQDVNSIIRDLERLNMSRYALTASEDRNVWLAQKSVAEEKPVEMSWSGLRAQMAFQTPMLNEDEYPNPPGWKTPASELLIDFGRIGCRNIRIKEPIHMSPFGLLVIRGNGKISIDLDGVCDTYAAEVDEAVSRWGAPFYPFVILLDGATLENRTLLDNEEAGLMYMVGRYSFLNFLHRNELSVAEDPRYILTGRAGYSFVRNGVQAGRNGLYGVLSSGCKKLFAQQKWDELDIRGLLGALRLIRGERSSGDVQGWLEKNVENVLMRNFGRYDV